MTTGSDRNSDGKRYDALHPYRLVITIIRGDDRSAVMSRMARGTIVGYQTEDEAIKAQDEFHKLCDMVKAEDPFATYGVTCILYTYNGYVLNSRNIE